MKRLVPILIFLVVGVMIIGIGVARLSRQFLDSFLAEWSIQGTEIQVGEIDYLWPLGLRIHDVEVEGDGFFLEVPVLTARLPLKELLNRRREIELQAEKVTVVSTSISFWSIIPDLPLHEIPDCRLKIAQLIISETDMFTGPMGLEFAKRDNLLNFRTLDASFALRGRLTEKETLLLNIVLDENHKEMVEVLWNFAERNIQGIYENDQIVHFESPLEFTDSGAVKLTDLEVREPRENGFVLRGEGALDLFSDFEVVLGGALTIDGVTGTVMLEANILPSKQVEGVFSLTAEYFDLALRGGFLLSLEKFQLRGNILPGSFMGETELQAEWELVRSEESYRLLFHTPALYVSFTEHVSHLSAFGAVKGWLEFVAGEPVGSIDFLGESIEFKEYSVYHPQLNIHILPGGRVEMTGQGEFLSGALDVSGVWDGEVLVIEGKVRELPVNELLEESLPVTGMISGNLKLATGKDSPPLVSLELTEGDIFLEHSLLGSVRAGNIILDGEKVRLEELTLEKGKGKLYADIIKTDEEVVGEIRVEAFSVIHTLEGWEVEFLLTGDGKFSHKQESWEAEVRLESPRWQVGAFTGEHLLFQGWLENDTIEIEHFSTVFPQGSMEFSGRVTPFHSLQIQGVLTSLVLPEDAGFEYRGELDEISFTAAGFWENIDFSFHGEGRDFFLGDRLLGEYFRISLGGETALPGPGENVELSRYLGPEVLEHGEIVVLGVNLGELVGGVELDEYGVSVTCDLHGQLDLVAGRWFFTTDNLRGNWDDSFYFTGDFAFEYRDGIFFVSELSLIEERDIISLNGNGWIDPASGGVDINLQLFSSGYLPLPSSVWEGDIRLVGEAELNIQGNMSDPKFGGKVVLERLDLIQGQESIFMVSDMLGFITEKPSLVIQDGKGTLAGFDFVCRGEIDGQKADIMLDLSGMEGMFGTGELFRGRWEGELRISGPWNELEGRGELRVFDGVIDSTVASDEGSSSEIFGGIEKTLQELPFPLKLSLLVSDILHVRTHFLEIYLRGGLEIKAGNGELEAIGRLDVAQGVYNLVLNEIDVEGYVFFGSFFGLEPQLDLVGRKRIGRYRVTLRARGPLDGYEMTLESQPSLSQEEIVSLLLLGSPEAYTSLDRIDLQGPLVKAAQFLLGIDGKDLEKHLFFDGIELAVPGQDQSGFYGVKFSKDLGENLSVSYTQDLGGEGKSSLGFELDLSREWSFRTEIQRDGRMEWELEFHTQF